MIDERYTIIQTSWLDEQPSPTRTPIRRSCNPRKSAELNPYWVDFEKGGDRDTLTWGGDDSIEYDKGIRNSVCGKKDDGGEKDGPFNTDGFTKGSKSSTGGGQEGFDTTTSSSTLLPVGETWDNLDDGNTSTPPYLSSTSPDEDTGKAIDTSFFSSAAPSSASIALQDNINKNYNNNNNNNDNDYEDEATISLDTKFFTRQRTRKRAAGVSWGLIVFFFFFSIRKKIKIK